MSTTTDAAEAARRELADFTGEVIGPDDAAYERRARSTTR